MTTVIEHPAQNLTMRTELTFNEFADHVWRTNRRQLRYSDGAMIELQPDLAYSFLMLGMERLLTPEEFGVVYFCVMQALEQAEKKGLIPTGLVKSVATPFDVPNRPAIPDKFADDIEEEATVKTYLTGEVSFTVAKEYPIETVEPEECDGEVVIDDGDTDGGGA